VQYEIWMLVLHAITMDAGHVRRGITHEARLCGLYRFCGLHMPMYVRFVPLVVRTADVRQGI
jgi:hypothetical protein